MLRQKILRKIYFTTLIVFILFVISSFTINKNISNIKVEYQANLSSIYLLDDNDYLLEVNIVVKDNIMDSIPVVINNLKAGNKHYSGLRGILPNNTEINELILCIDCLGLYFYLVYFYLCLVASLTELTMRIIVTFMSGNMMMRIRH